MGAGMPRTPAVASVIRRDGAGRPRRPGYCPAATPQRAPARRDGSSRRGREDPQGAAALRWCLSSSAMEAGVSRTRRAWGLCGVRCWSRRRAGDGRDSRRAATTVGSGGSGPLCPRGHAVWPDRGGMMIAVTSVRGMTLYNALAGRHVTCCTALPGRVTRVSGRPRRGWWRHSAAASDAGRLRPGPRGGHRPESLWVIMIDVIIPHLSTSRP